MVRVPNRNNAKGNVEAIIAVIKKRKDQLNIKKIFFQNIELKLQFKSKFSIDLVWHELYRLIIILSPYIIALLLNLMFCPNFYLI